MMVSMGAFMTMVSFLGCCAGMKKSKFLASLYLVLVFLAILVEIAGGIVMLTYAGELASVSDSIATSGGGWYSL
jgi:hypothetical protein